MLRVASRVTGKPENGITGKPEDGNPLRESRQSSRIKKQRLRENLWRFVDDIFWSACFLVCSVLGVKR